MFTINSRRCPGLAPATYFCFELLPVPTYGHIAYPYLYHTGKADANTSASWLRWEAPESNRALVFPKPLTRRWESNPHHHLQITRLLPIIIGAPPEIRTPTIPGLNRLPLPIGLEGHNMVRLARLELARYYYREILSLPCLPIPSQAHNGGVFRFELKMPGSNPVP